MNDRSNERSETEERVAENAAPSPRRSISPKLEETDPATGLPAGAHDDDASPLDRGRPLDPFGGTSPREALESRDDDDTDTENA